MSSQHSATASLLEFDSNIPYNIFIRNLKLLKAGQVVVDFNITLDNNRVIFYGLPDRNKSRTVGGKVRLELAGKLHVKEIMITLAGEFHIISENSDLGPRHGTLFSTCILLANKRTLAPGMYEFFFEFLLPGDLPESISSDLILCEYFLKAELISRCPDELSAANNKVVDVVDLFIQRTALQSDENIRQGLDATRYTGSIGKILDYEFLIPKIMRLDTDMFTFHARWDGLRVDNVKFWLIQTESFKGLSSKKGSESLSDGNTKVVSGPFCFDLPKREPLKLQSRPMVFQLPITEPLVWDYDLNDIEIRHKLVISIQMANKNVISLNIPIAIESIVTDLDDTPPPCRISQSNHAAHLHFANKIYPGRPIENNDQQKSSSTPSSSFKRFVRAERRRNTVIVEQSSESTTKAESLEQINVQLPRRSSNVVQRRKSTNTNSAINTIIESASECNTIDESSNATTVTYTNNTEHERNSHVFPQKGFHNISPFSITEKINKLRNRNTIKKRISRGSSSAFAPGLIEVISMRPNVTDVSNINNASLTT